MGSGMGCDESDSDKSDKGGHLAASGGCGVIVVFLVGVYQVNYEWTTATA